MSTRARLAFVGACVVVAAVAAGPGYAGLVSSWSFDEAASGTGIALDAVGTNHGFFEGTATYTAGLIGTGAALLNHIPGDGVNVGNGGGDFSFTTGMSVEALIQPGAALGARTYEEVFRKDDGGNRILLSFQLNGSILSFGINDGTGYKELDMPLDGASGRPTLAGLKDGSPHHIVATYDSPSGAKTLYVDGTPRYSTTVGAGVNMVSGGGAPAYIGNSLGGPEPFNGVIDEVGIYDAALSAPEVAAHYALVQAGQSYLPAALPPPPPPPPLSALIDDRDYSDTFTLTAYGGRLGRVASATAESPPATHVEDNHGNPPRTWSSGMWSLSTDAAAWGTGVSPYPGTSGAGSDTGITQRGGGGDWGIEYGLRHDFVVQTDFVQTADRVDITAGAARDTIAPPYGLSVFFRTTGHAGPEIGLYSSATAEVDTGLTSGIPVAGQWHNYAVRFNQVSRELEVFVDQVSRGVIDLDTIAGGAFSSYALSNAAVSIGGAGGNRTWCDNFQVGDPVGEPEPYFGVFPDYKDTFTVGTPARPDGLHNNNAGGGYNIEQAFGGAPVVTWAPMSNFSFNSAANTTNPGLLAAAAGNPGAATGMAQSGGGDFSIPYGLRDSYVVSLDAILPPGDRLDISSLPAAGASIFSADSLSVFFRRDTVTNLGAIGLFNGAAETWVYAPGTLGIDDADWHNFAVLFDQPNDILRAYVDGVMLMDLDLTTFAGGLYQSYSNAAVGAGGAGYNWGYPGGPYVLWIDNFQVGVLAPEPVTLALVGLGLAALARRRRR